MFDFLCYQPSDSYLPKQTPVSHIRIFHAASACRKLDIHASGHIIASSLAYKRYTPYFPIPSRQHKIKVFTAGDRIYPRISVDIAFDTDLIYTLSIIGGADKTELLLINDIKPVCRKGLASVRFINLSPACQALDLYKPCGEALFTNAIYKSITEYVSVEPGKCSLQVRQPNSGTILAISDTTFKPDWNYTIFAAGLLGQKKGLQAFVLLDGSTYINSRQSNPNPS